MPRPYQNSLFGCCSPFSGCLMAYCCTCMVVGKNHHRIARGTDSGYSACNGWCIGWAGLTALGGCGWILQMIDRGDMRQKYDLEGSGLGECCTAYWCACCEAAQTAKELEYEQVGRVGGNGYVAAEKMNAVPQQQPQQY